MKENNHPKYKQLDKQQQDTQADPQSHPDLKASDTLLVLHNRSKLVGIVQDINPDGTVQQTSTYQNTSDQILKIEQNENAFTQFYINFYHQLKNPQEYSFFKVTEYEAPQTASDLQQYIIDSGDENLQVLKEYEVSIDSVEAHYSNYLNNQRNQNSHNSPSNQNNRQSLSNENPSGFHFRSQRYLYDPDQIDWDVISKTGLSREKLENMKALEPLLKGYKTPMLLPIKISNDTTVLTTDARIALRVGNAGHLEIRFFPVKPEPDYTQPFQGHTFTKEDQINLQETGNMGRVVDLIHPITKEIQPSLISRDRLTNDLIPLNTQYIRIPLTIKGVTLDENQKNTLKEGRPLYIENMISRRGTLFNATVQFNADRQYVEFLFSKNIRALQSRTVKGQNLTHQESGIPITFRDKRLFSWQIEKLKKGEPAYINGLSDKNGKKYQGYITFDRNIGKFQFSFRNPVKEQAGNK
ncbi:DUF3945 domain-containing protein [Chryseobacterium caseinilyticum]|uniref:DUF3945 domain-containing protein n=1 Tax=Chryseobacterium caseinilyticum TaxID=2771428 RepID=A0ABR8ZGR7_9FLAO|nr:DUF3945 domain-containing protein [Chryseobacterium caseinilyticum]MBD8084498.1 DUF3945 domain-containing protein [Chryseobacterium caseinilyticum]